MYYRYKEQRGGSFIPWVGAVGGGSTRNRVLNRAGAVGGRAGQQLATISTGGETA
jgi:hypothetical protein